MLDKYQTTIVLTLEQRNALSKIRRNYNTTYQSIISNFVDSNIRFINALERKNIDIEDLESIFYKGLEVFLKDSE